MVDVLKIQTSLLSKSCVEKCNRMFEEFFFGGGGAETAGNEKIRQLQNNTSRRAPLPRMLARGIFELLGSGNPKCFSSFGNFSWEGGQPNIYSGSPAKQTKWLVFYTMMQRIPDPIT